LDENLHAKLCGFSLAQLITDLQPLESANLGFVEWRAPELFIPQQLPNEKSDVYSFGMVLWELATHQKPYAGFATSIAIMDNVLRGGREKIPDNCLFGDIIKDCWGRVPEERPTLQQIIEKLESLDVNVTNALKEKTELPDPANVPKDITPEKILGHVVRIRCVPTSADDTEIIHAQEETIRKLVSEHGGECCCNCEGDFLCTFCFADEKTDMFCFAESKSDVQKFLSELHEEACIKGKAFAVCLNGYISRVKGENGFEYSGKVVDECKRKLDEDCEKVKHRIGNAKG